MKRIICSLLAVILMLSCVPIFGNAAERGQEIIQFEDGSYIITEVITRGTRASGSTSGNKTSTYYNKSGVAQWKAVLNGAFTYNGSSATCTSASCSVTIYNSEWYTVSKSASKSGSTAYGSVTMGTVALGTVEDQVSANLNIKCDKNGNLS